MKVYLKRIMKTSNLYKIGIAILTMISLPLCAQPEHISLGTEGEALSLSQLLDSARQNNVTLRNAQRSLDAARQQQKEAFTNYFPTISATGVWFNANKGMAQTDINPSEMIPAGLGSSLSSMLPPAALAALANPISISMMKNGTIASVTAVQPVFAGGQIINGNRLAKVGKDVAGLQLKLSENEIEKTTEQYFWQMMSLQEKLKTIASVDSLLASLEHDVNVAVRAGLALRNDLLQVQLRRNDTESQRLKVENALKVVRLMLAQHCGLKNSNFNIQPVNYNSALELPSKQDPSQALLSTTEYQLLDKQVEAAKLQKRMAVGQNMPSIAVGAGYNYHNLMEKDHSFAMMFATVSVPISDWWGGSHNIRRKKIEFQKAVDEQQDKSAQLQIRIQNAWNNVTETRQQLELAMRSIEQATENLRLNREFYKAGTTKISDLLEAQMLYQQALDKRTDAYAEYQSKMLEYRQAIGQ